MKALSIRQPWAQWIAYGDKTVEVRSRVTHHRGPLAICSSAHPDPGFRDVVQEGNLPLGRLICAVQVVDCVPMTEEHFDGACLLWDDWRVIPEGGAWAWILANPRFLEPVPMKGSLNLWNLDDSSIRYIYECPSCKAPDRDPVPVYGDAEGDEDSEIQYLMCESCGAEFHELTRGEFGYVRLPGMWAMGRDGRALNGMSPPTRKAASPLAEYRRLEMRTYGRQAMEDTDAPRRPGR